MRFLTDFRYTDRETKARYVWLKYQSILSGARILDVGGDRSYLRQHLDASATYLSIDTSQEADMVTDLERQRLPFDDRSYDCVLCLDVLEHVDNIHALFDELCRVSRGYVVISLPNAWSAFWGMLRRGEYHPGVPMKFYGLPVDPPADRHKWFFNEDEARRFIEERGRRSGLRVVQMDGECEEATGSGVRRLARRLALSLLVNRTIVTRNLYSGTLWAVLQRE